MRSIRGENLVISRITPPSGLHQRVVRHGDAAPADPADNPVSAVAQQHRRQAAAGGAAGVDEFRV